MHHFVNNAQIGVYPQQGASEDAPYPPLAERIAILESAEQCCDNTTLSNGNLTMAQPSQPIFTRFGLYWSLDDVHWEGKPRNEQGLWGREKTRLERRGRPTTIENDNGENYSEFVGLYCLYREGRLIYVGEAGLGNNSHLFNRLKQHRKDHLADQWDEFSWFGRPAGEAENTSIVKDAFAQMEALIIAVVNPGSNKQNGTFAGATQVFQLPSEHAEGDVDTKLGRLMAKLEDIEERLASLR